MPWVRAPPARSGQVVVGRRHFSGYACASDAQRADQDNRVPWRCPGCVRLRRALGRRSGEIVASEIRAQETWAALKIIGYRHMARLPALYHGSGRCVTLSRVWRCADMDDHGAGARFGASARIRKLTGIDYRGRRWRAAPQHGGDCNTGQLMVIVSRVTSITGQTGPRSSPWRAPTISISQIHWPLFLFAVSQEAPAAGGV